MIRNFNKDIMDWHEFPKYYDIIWTDPPWGEGMVKLFQTMLKKDTGAIVSHGIHDILQQLFSLSDREKPLVVEYGVKGFDKVIEIAEVLGHKLISTNYRMQSMGRPFVILVFNRDVVISNDDGAKIITNTLKGTDFEVVFDPFAGVGFTAKAVIKAGKIYVGSELNPKRFRKLLEINR